MSEELTKHEAGTAIESVIAKGDLAKLTPQERINYYRSVCTSLGLNPLTQPFGYINLSGRLTLYAKRDAADQLRKLHGITFPDKPEMTLADDIVTVLSHARDRDGRDDYDIGAVPIGGLKGADRANAVMKAITKSKRRVTLSLVGLGWLDETEMDTVADARPIDVAETGEIVESINSKPQPPKMFKPAQSPPVEPPDAPPVPAQPIDSNAPNTALKLLAYVNEHVQVPYDNLYHLRSAIGKELKDTGWDWRAPTDHTGWQQALDAAVKHANDKLDAETINQNSEMQAVLDRTGKD